ncbi:MAG: creatinine amidohydrolase, partial [Frankiales bacterium]|nr:creatinine amidohydrolase [Frankiales bacterium]
MQSAARRWAELTWPEVRDSVTPDQGHAVGLVPVGATEQHGPHLPVGTDTLVAQAICDAASVRTGALVLPALPVGVSYGHGTVLPGTLSLSPE